MFSVLTKRLSKFKEISDEQNRRIILSLLEEEGKSRNVQKLKILDLGCGSGEFTLEIAKVTGCNELYGLEIVEEYAQLSEDKGIKVYRADLNEPFPIESESFDIVCANQVIEHLHHTDLFFRELYRILKFGGVAIISTPNLAEFTNIVSLIMGFQPPTIFASDDFHFLGFPFHPKYKMKRNIKHSGHIRGFVPRAIKDLAQVYGFKVEKMIGVGSLLLPQSISSILSKITPNYSLFITMKLRKPINARAGLSLN